MSGRKLECESPHHRIGRQVPERLARRLESLWPLIASETPKRRAPERQVQSPQPGVATRLRRRELRCSPGPSRTARPTISPARVRQSSLRSAYYLLTKPNRLFEIICRFSMLQRLAGLNGVQEVASSNLAGPTNSPPVGDHFPLVATTLNCDGLRRCPAASISAACGVPIRRWSLPPDVRAVLARTSREATGVPTVTVGAPQPHLSALADSPRVPLERFLSEFGQLDRG
jgi:hypothetical protein